jgi:putative ABC transport system permease protein
MVPLFDTLSGFRHNIRGLWRRPGFAAAAVLTLALGIGATTAIFSVVYGVLIKPLPYPEADALVSLRLTAPGLDPNEHGIAPSMYYTYREENRTFEHVGLWANGGQTLTGDGEPEQLAALVVTQGTLEALGVQPLLGRLFSEAEYTSAAQGDDPVILSYAFWQRRFGGDESVVGRTLTLDSRPWQVVGVMPPDFRFLNFSPTPAVISAIRTDGSQMTFARTVSLPITLGNLGFNAFARLKQGVTLAEANADVSRMLPIWLDAWPPPPGLSREAIADWRIAPGLKPLKDNIVGGIAGMLWVLMGTVGAVLLIACANVANLLLARADARQQELAIRAALGAGRWRIATEHLRESLVLGVLGGVAGLALAYAALEILAVLSPANLPRVEEITVNPVILVFTVTVTVVSSLLFGSIPAVKQAFMSDAPLVGSARGASAGRGRSRARNALIVVQVALAVVLLVGAGLMIRTFLALNAVDAGFAPENVQVARINVPPTVMPEAERYGRVQRDILERIEALPGVTAAGFSYGVPMERRVLEGAIFVEDRPYAVGELPPSRRFKFISPGYLETLGTRLIAGRDITWPDVEQGGMVALVSENLARELWGAPQAAIGKRIREDASGIWREIVGVTQDVHEDVLYERPPPIVYWPVMMQGFSGVARYGRPAIAYAIRSERAGTESLMSEVRRAVWASNPDLPIFLVTTLKDLLAATLARTSFALVILAVAGTMALCLGVVGIYGVISYVVSQRAREIGIRLALGARPRAVRRMFVLRSLAVATIGVAAGLAAATAFGRWMASLLFEVRPLDPMTYVGVLALLFAAIWLAAYLPARRAAALDPVETLRAE